MTMDKKYESLVDKNDLLIKHATGEYINLNECPEPDDIIFYILSKGKQKMKKSELNKFFGEEKKENLIKSLLFLSENNYIKIENSESVISKEFLENEDSNDFVIILI